MSFISRLWSRHGLRTSRPPRVFANPNFTRLPKDLKIEEETLPDYQASRYYPVHIGEIFNDRYQVVGKLGFGASSTVWLAHDLSQRRHVALKVFIKSQALGEHVEHEMSMFKRIEQHRSRHPGRHAIRKLLDSFRIQGPQGEHLVLAHAPLWQSVEQVVRRSSPRRLPASGLSYVLKDIFLALEYLHNDCRIIHTDIKADNIMFSIPDTSVLHDFEEDEMLHPSPRKEVDGRTIYLSRAMKSSGQTGPPILCDFGSAVTFDGDVEHTECVQPNVYRAPEVTLGAAWDYKIDIWNVGCMAWDLYEGNLLFQGIDPEHHTYRRRAHLAEMVALLGPPPNDLLARGTLTDKFFSHDGTFVGGIGLPIKTSLGASETLLTGDDKRRFLEFMEKMLQWDPKLRSTAGDLFQDPWLQEKGVIHAN